METPLLLADRDDGASIPRSYYDEDAADFDAADEEPTRGGERPIGIPRKIDRGGGKEDGRSAAAFVVVLYPLLLTLLPWGRSGRSLP